MILLQPDLFTRCDTRKNDSKGRVQISYVSYELGVSYDATNRTCPLSTPYSPYTHPQVRRMDLIYHCQTVF